MMSWTLFNYFWELRRDVGVLLLTMVNPCSIYGCKNGYKKPPYNGHFHSFYLMKVDDRAGLKHCQTLTLRGAKINVFCDVH